MTRDDYIRLITTEHKPRPRFVDTVSISVGAFAQAGAVLSDTINTMDLDKARGDQLDTLSKWIGFARGLQAPIEGVYFTWDDTVDTGWAHGRWRGVGDADVGVESLGDEELRMMLKLKVAANSWDGSLQQLREIYNQSLAGKATVAVFDNMDMTMTVRIAATDLSQAERALFTGESNPLKPAGVSVNYVFE